MHFAIDKYMSEDTRKFLNSGEFKSFIARRLGIHTKAFNEYIEQNNLTYKAP